MFGPWGVQYALAKMGLPTLPGGGMDARARANVVIRYQPTILLCTPSYALHLGRTVEALGVDPRATAVRTLFVAGEPGMSVAATRERIQELWGARLVEFYGCTEASPHVGGFSCAYSQPTEGPVTTHLLEDVQVWETVDPHSRQAQSEGERGLTVCTNLNSKSSPQLRFLVGDYATFDRTPLSLRAVACARGRLLRRPRRRPYQSARHQDVSGTDRACGALDCPGIGDEFEILLMTNADGLDVMTVRVEHHAGETIAATVIEEIRTRCEVRAAVEVLAPGTLSRTEFKAARVRDRREKPA